VRGDLAPGQAEQRRTFLAALQHYRAGDWPAARRGFAECLALDATDPAVHVILDRLETLEAAPPPNWDGVWRFAEK